jgi:hypothetical protein
MVLAGPVVSAHATSWHAETILESEHGVGGVAIGDVDPDHAGNEVVAVNDIGEVWLICRADDGWRSERIHIAGGELIMCAIGNVDPTTPGNEIVAVGMVEGPESTAGRGQVVVLGRDSAGWRATSVFIDTHMIHGVAVGDVAVRYAGNEIIACGFNHRVTLIHRDGDSWTSEVVYVGNDRLKNADIGRIVPDRPGMDVVVGGSDGRIVMLHEGELGWVHEIVLDDVAGQSRVTANGTSVLAGGDDGTVTLLTRTDAGWQRDVIGRDAKKIRGVALTDIDGDAELEAFSAGYSGNVIAYDRDADGNWSRSVVYSDARPLHHLVAGELDAAHSGLELVAAGHSGNVVLLRRPEP